MLEHTTEYTRGLPTSISSLLGGGYSHPLAREWQNQRQLTKVFILYYIKSVE